MIWNEIRLEEISEFRNGVNYSCESFGTGIKVISVADFKDRMVPDYESLGELDADSKWSSECFLKENDIVFVRSNGNKNLIGRSVFIKNLPTNIKVTFSAFSIRLRFKSLKDVSPDYYLYLFKSPIFRSILSQYGNGANISNLNQDILNNMVVPKPPLKVQKKIALVLSNYDELIESNSKRINFLEELAKETYKEWFVRMRFPGYESHAFVNKLPKGWENGSLGELVEFKKGKNITLDTVIEGNVPVVAGGLSPAYYHNAANTVSPTVTISASGANAGFVNLYYEDIWASDCSYVDTRSTSCLFYIYTLLKTRQTEVTFLQRGAAQPHVYPKDIMSLKTIKPSIHLIEEFENFSRPLFDEIKTLTEKNRILQQTRDLLLPRLISGKLSVEYLLEKEEYSVR